MTSFAGKYKMEKQENQEAFMSALGVGLLLRKASTKLGGSAIMEIKKESGDTWKLIMSSPLKNVEVGPFRFGEPFDEKTADGRECRSTINMEGDDTWVHRQDNKKSTGKDVVIVRKFHEGGVNVRLTCGGVTAQHTFVRI